MDKVLSPCLYIVYGAAGECICKGVVHVLHERWDDGLVFQINVWIERINKREKENIVCVLG
jgi:hypothetical protein